MSKKVIVITMDTDSNQILDSIELSDCSAIGICPEGYVCVPKEPQGEQQQYPTGKTEEFVQRVTGGNLKDIALDDPRWGNRKVGEVFARENTANIVWYWPKGGEANFDPTKLGNLVSWYDYRTAYNAAGGGPYTRLPVSAGMSIWFRDSGGGVSIFQKK